MQSSPANLRVQHRLRGEDKVDYKRIRPSQVRLDQQNPRLPDGTSGDKEAVNRLLAEGQVQLTALARDLLDRGSANPTELPILVKEGTKYVVLEGNRRFAALKLLADPKLADDPSHRAVFERLMRSGRQPPKTLYCAIAQDRAEADHWITLRHTGANDGVGVRVWSAEQNARHRQRMNAPIDSGTLRSISIADELTEAYQWDIELVDAIKQVRQDKLTNIGRFFSGVMLTRMHFQLKRNADGTQALWARHTANQLHPYFKWAFDFLAKEPVDAFKNDAIRNKLFDENAAHRPDMANLMSQYRRLADSHHSSPSDDDKGNSGADNDEADGSEEYPSGGGGVGGSQKADGSGSTSSGSTSGKRDQKPERALYSTVKLSNLSANTQRLLREARKLALDDEYAIACVLARVILELAVSDPKVLAWSGKKEADPLAEKIKACIVTLDPDIDSPRKRQRQDLVQAHLETASIGVTYLHQFMHNPSARPDPHLARRFSGIYAPLLNGINEALA